MLDFFFEMFALIYEWKLFIENNEWQYNNEKRKEIVIDCSDVAECGWLLSHCKI